jgi:hypothetical protein
MIKVTAPDSHFLPTYLNGKWWQMINLAVSRGYIVQKFSDYSQLLFKDASYLSLPYCLAAAADGYTIYNYEIFLSLDPINYNDEVPVGIPNRSIIDEEGIEIILTWAQWGSSAHVDLTNGNKGIPLVYSNVALTNVEAALLSGLTGCTLLGVSDYRELLPSSEEII